METIQNNLLKIRLRLGYKSQQDFGDFIGVSRSNYNLIENNRKQVTLLLALRITKKIQTKDPNIHVEDIFELAET